MAEAITERVRRYILDGTDQDLRRLLSISELSAEMARTAFRRLGVRQGWNAIDCGCGPIGGLAVMAEMVGPAGRVVVDFNQAAAQRARAIVSALELGNVEVVAGFRPMFSATPSRAAATRHGRLPSAAWAAAAPRSSATAPTPRRDFGILGSARQAEVRDPLCVLAESELILVPRWGRGN